MGLGIPLLAGKRLAVTSIRTIKRIINTRKKEICDYLTRIGHPLLAAAVSMSLGRTAQV